MGFLKPLCSSNTAIYSSLSIWDNLRRWVYAESLENVCNSLLLVSNLISKVPQEILVYIYIYFFYHVPHQATTLMKKEQQSIILDGNIYTWLKFLTELSIREVFWRFIHKELKNLKIIICQMFFERVTNDWEKHMTKYKVPKVVL